MNARMWRCVGNNKLRILVAADEAAASEKCVETYGYHPETVTEIFRNPLGDG